MVTVIGLSFGRLLSGAVIIESVFAWPGLGLYAFRSATSLDFPAIMGVGIVVATVYVLANLLVDVAYALIDPRIQVGGAASMNADRPVGLDGDGLRPVRCALWLALAGWRGAPLLRAVRAAPARTWPGRLAPPSGDHWLGTDALGRDILSRILYGARISIPVGLAAVILAALLGGAGGRLAGFVGRRLDDVVMRVTDLMLAFPTVILALVITAALGVGIRNAVIAIMVAWWPTYARLVRGLVLAVREREYVQVAVRAGRLGRARPLPLRRPERALVDRRPGDARRGPRDPDVRVALASSDSGRRPRCRSGGR